MNPSPILRGERATKSDMVARLVRVLRHVRDPRSLPELVRKNIDHAVASGKQAIASRRPGYWDERGRSLAQRENYAEALECFEHALAKRAADPRILNDLAEVLLALDRLDDAETTLGEALRLNPDLARTHNNLGHLMNYRGRFEEAEASVRSALCLQPEHAPLHHHLGNILYNLGRVAEAEASYRTALRIQPEHRGSHVNLGRTLLLAGRFEEGWKEFRWRFEMTTDWNGRRFAVPFWNGEPIGERRILLYADRGLGDTIQLCRYVPQIAAGARTILAVQPGLVRLLSRLPGVGQIVTRGDEEPAFDLYCALMSLPLALGTTLETIPAMTAYLTPDPADAACWRERLSGVAGLRVGLCWAGDRWRDPRRVVIDRRRSITLDTLAPLGGMPGVEFVSLQKGPPAAEAAHPPHGMTLHDFTDDLQDFADTAALIDALDLVISVDTSVAHMAGALGKPVWLLNRFDTDWRWLQDREDSPWYPTLRQFRQATPGDWHGVIGRVRDALRQLAAGDRVTRSGASAT